MMCTNYGNVSAVKSGDVGGITSLNRENCTLNKGVNYGTLVAGTGNVGGIVATNNGTLENCGTGRRAWETGNGNFLYEDEGSGKEKIVVCSYSDMTDWLLITVTDKSTAFKDVTEMKKASVIIGSLYVLFILIAYCFFSKEFFGPMKKLSRKLYNVTERKFEKIEETGRRSEERRVGERVSTLV